MTNFVHLLHLLIQMTRKLESSGMTDNIPLTPQNFENFKKKALKNSLIESVK